MRTILLLFIATAACETTSSTNDASVDGSTEGGCIGTASCFTSCEDDAPGAPATCVDGAWQCAFSCDSCHCGIPCSLPVLLHCETCDGGGALKVCNFDSGTQHPYECPSGSYDSEDPDAGVVLCGVSDAGAE